MKPIKNPDIVVCKIEEDFFAVVNPFIKDGMKIINRKQFEILNLIDGNTNIKQIAHLTNFPADDILTTCKIFEEKIFINFSGVFSEPTWDKKTETLNLWGHTTNDCNLICSYCYIHTLGAKEDFKEQNIEILCNKLIETAKINQLKQITLRMAGGEPLMKFCLWKPYLLELKKELKDISCKLYVTYLTNLVIIDKEILDFIKDNSFGIGVSLDGIEEFQNNTRHFKNGSGSFHIVEKNIKKLIENDISLGIMTTVTNENLDGLIDLTQFVIDNNLHTRFSFAQGDKCRKMDIKKLINTLKLCYEKYEYAIDNGFLFSKLHKLCDLHLNEPFFQTCSNGYNGAALYIDGNIYFCHRHFGKEVPYGSIFEEDNLLSIIQRKTFYADMSVECKKCNLRYLCTSGCPLEKENDKDPYCEVYKEIIPIIFRLKGKERLLELKKNYNLQKGGDNNEWNVGLGF